MSLEATLQSRVQDNEAALTTLQIELGRVVMVFGPLELFLDCIVSIIFLRFAGNKIEDELPRSLKRKVAFVKKSLRRIADLKPLLESAMPLLIEISNLAEQRHQLIHGCNLHTPRDGDTAQLDFVKLAYGEQIHSIDTHKFTIPEIRLVSDRMIFIGLKLAQFGDGLLMVSEIVNNSDKPASEI